VVRSILIAITMVSLSAVYAQASLIGVESSMGLGGTMAVEVVPQAGDDLRNDGTYPEVDNYYLLQFATNHALTADYNVEHDGSPGAAIVDANKVGGTLSAGTLVNSYLFHSDSNDGGMGAAVFQMEVTFDNPIIGLNGGDDATTGESHATSFGEFDNVGVMRFPAGDGHFSFASNDTIISISADRRTISVNSQVNNNTADANAFDQLWVITAVPEPDSFLVALLALTGLGFLACRTRVLG